MTEIFWDPSLPEPGLLTDLFLPFANLIFDDLSGVSLGYLNLLSLSKCICVINYNNMFYDILLTMLNWITFHHSHSDWFSIFSIVPCLRRYFWHIPMDFWESMLNLSALIYHVFSSFFDVSEVSIGYFTSLPSTDTLPFQDILAICQLGSLFWVLSVAIYRQLARVVGHVCHSEMSWLIWNSSMCTPELSDAGSALVQAALIVGVVQGEGTDSLHT